MPTSSDKTDEIRTNITIYDTYSSNADLPAPVPSGADLPASHQSANLPILIGIVWKSGWCSNIPALLAPAKVSYTEFPSLDHLDYNEKSNIRNLFQNWIGLFSLDTMDICIIPDVTHKIPTDAKPTSRQWGLPQMAHTTNREQCDGMARVVVIEPSTRPWLSRVVLVRKKNGIYLILQIQQVIDDLHQRHVFSSLDAHSVYWAVPVELADRSSCLAIQKDTIWSEISSSNIQKNHQSHTVIWVKSSHRCIPWWCSHL